MLPASTKSAAPATTPSTLGMIHYYLMNPRLRLLLSALLLALAGAGVALLWLTLLDRRLDLPAVQHFDLALQLRLHALGSPTLTRLMLTLTFLGAIKTFAPAVTLIVVLLLRRRHRESATLLGGAMLGALLLNESLKLHFHRLRPRLPWSIGDEHTFSFPSGHSLFAVVLYGVLASLALRHLRAPRPHARILRALILLAALFMPLAIGTSRIYLGMHFPTDVLAGWLTGLLWLCTVLAIDRLQPIPSQRH